MNKPAYLYLVLILLIVSTSVSGENLTFGEDFTLGIGVGIGSSQFQLNKSNIVADYGNLSNTSAFTDSSTAFSIYTGMKLDQYLDLELDFLLKGDMSAKEGGQTIKLFDVSTVALTLGFSRQFSDRFNVFAKLGIHFWDISESFGSQSTINSAADITYGLGMDINIYGNQSRQLRVQWNHYEYDGVYIDSSEVVTLSLLFLFGKE